MDKPLSGLFTKPAEQPQENVEETAGVQGEDAKPEQPENEAVETTAPENETTQETAQTQETVDYKRLYLELKQKIDEAEAEAANQLAGVKESLAKALDVPAELISGNNAQELVNTATALKSYVNDAVKNILPTTNGAARATQHVAEPNAKPVTTSDFFRNLARR